MKQNKKLIFFLKIGNAKKRKFGVGERNGDKKHGKSCETLQNEPKGN